MTAHSRSLQVLGKSSWLEAHPSVPDRSGDRNKPAQPEGRVAGAPPEEGARAWAQVLTPRWPQLPEWHPQFPSGVCCKQAPPETSGRKRKHLPKEQIPGLSVRGGGNHIPRQAQVSKLPPPPTPSRSRAGAPLCRAMPATWAPCRRDRTDTRPPQASNAERRPRPPGVTSQERRRQAQVAPPPVHPWTGNLCPWRSRAHVLGRPWCCSGEDVTF